MPRYDLEPAYGYPELPPQMREAGVGRDTIEEKDAQIIALAARLAVPEHLLKLQEEAEERRRAAGLYLGLQRPAPPGLIGPGPTGQQIPVQVAGANPAEGKEAQLLADNPRWQNAVRSAVEALGADADRVALRAHAMRLFETS